MELEKLTYEELLKKARQQEQEIQNIKADTEGKNDYFSELLDYLDEGFVITNKEGYITTATEPFAKMCGYSSPKELIGIHMTSLYANPNDRKNMINKIKVDKALKSYELLLQRKDGSTFWSSCSIRLLEGDNQQVIGTDGLIRDISSSKKIEKELTIAKEIAEESDFRYHQLTETASDAIYLVNQEGIIVETNGIAAKMLHMDKNEIIGHSMSKVDPNFSNETFIAFWDKIPYDSNAIFETSHKTKEGDLIPIEISGRKVIDKNTTLYLGMARDITIRKEYEKELIVAKEKAEESDRLKSAFLQNLSHEIRTPLNAICGFTGMLNSHNLSNDKKNSFVSVIQTSSNQLLSIVSNILTIATLETKQETVNNEKVCINNIIVDLLSIFKQQSANQTISLYAKQPLSNNQSEIYTDKTKVTQILSNLISNALKFTHEGFVEFGYNLKSNELEFYVKDSGIGINVKHQEKIFERFRQAEESTSEFYGGTGLGLSISKGFVELLGGQIWVSSEIDKGSTFYFTIPYKPVNETYKTTDINQSDNKPTVLVAEDEEFNFLLIEELLNEYDLKLIHTKNGQETVDIFKSNPDISLILMDIKMPIMDGHTAAKLIKEIKPNMPIVSQSAYALDHEIENFSGTFDDYLAKPIEQSLLIEKVNKYLIRT